MKTDSERGISAVMVEKKNELVRRLSLAEDKLRRGTAQFNRSMEALYSEQVQGPKNEYDELVEEARAFCDSVRDELLRQSIAEDDGGMGNTLESMAREWDLYKPEPVDVEQPAEVCEEFAVTSEQVDGLPENTGDAS